MTFGGMDGKFAAIGRTGLGEACRIVDIAIERGVTLFDTSDNYANGRSEEILGAALNAKRGKVVIASKVFGRTGPGEHDIGLSRRHVVEACEASLRRLGTDWIDLYQVHNHDALVPMEETLRALDDLIAAGKVRYIGCSNHFAWQLAKALGISDRLGLQRYISQQVLYSLLYRQSEAELLPAAIDMGVGSLIYSPLAQGYLTGKFARPDPTGRLLATNQLTGVDTERAQGIVATLMDLATEVNATPGQVALQWLIGRKGVASVIIGARSEGQLTDNLGACHVVLTAEHLARIDAVSGFAPWYPATAQRVFHPERNCLG
jgi:aryl-alcohol dehydrogenase-like predicted oxidoreductase